MTCKLVMIFWLFGSLFVGALQAAEFVRVPAGRYKVGSPLTEPGRNPNEAMPMEVSIERAFDIGKNEVTHGEFEPFLNEARKLYPEKIPHEYLLPFEFSETDRLHPATHVTWLAAAAYCNWLSRKEGRVEAYDIRFGKARLIRPFDGGYRLPTELEWEVTARAGAATAFFFGEDWKNFGDTYTRIFGAFRARQGLLRFAPEQVGKHRSNKLGLHDVCGNVAEWVGDAYRDQPIVSQSEALASVGIRRTVKGGSSANAMWYRRSASRQGLPHDWAATDLGFRIVRDAEK